MLILKRNLTLALLLSVLFISSCDTDTATTCTPPSVVSNIIGSWNTPDGSSVEFQSNGTLLDPNSSIIGGYIGSDTLSEKSYTITTDSLFVVAASATTTNSINSGFPITENKCDEITLSMVGLSYKLSRK